MESGIGLHSGNLNEKRLVSTVAEKPYSSLGGFHVFSLSPLAVFGKRLAECYLHRKQRFQKCYVIKIWDTLENLSNSACFLLSVPSTNILGRVGNAKVLTWLQIIASCHTMVFIVKHTIPGIERGRGLSFDGQHRATRHAL